MSVGLKDGLFAGVGFFIGYFLTRWFIAVLIIIICTVSICTVCVKHEQGTTKILNKIEKATKIDIVDPKYGLKAGDMVRYHDKCRVRTAPTKKALIIGKIKPGKEYRVLAKQGNWRMLQIAKNRSAWVGCRP